MKSKIRIAVIGGGNISNTRHIPGLIKNKDKFEILGVVSDEAKKVDRTLKKYRFLHNALVLDKNVDYEGQFKACDWFQQVDAVIIGVPPKQHYKLTKACLMFGKHVLVEKPMMMSKDECNDVVELAKEKNRVLYVMHSFQFSDGMIRLKKIAENQEMGKIKSILELQLSNRKRRLPIWYNDLPLGLYYDEAAHFFYGARKFGGELKVLNAHAQFNNVNDATPRFLEAQLQSGNIPVQMYMNFNSPICEWGLILIGEKKIAIYDYFKDILIVLKNDGEHYAKDVLQTSLSFSWQFWKGFLKNGIKMVRGDLLYGHDKCIEKFADAIMDNAKCFELSGELGIEVVSAMNEVIDCINKK
jgi:predicted dehydrogenase